jgi:hypothetical protein
VPNAADCLQQRPVAEALDRALTEHGSAIVTQILSGLGEVGKTQVAASAGRHLTARGAVDDVVWISATTPDAIVSTLGEAGVLFADAPGDDPGAAARRFDQPDTRHHLARWRGTAEDPAGAATAFEALLTD